MQGHRFRPGLRVDASAEEVVVLDVAGGVVHRLVGPAADACRDILGGRRPEPEAARGLVDTGILAAAPEVGIAPGRRSVLTGAVIGVVSTALPGAAAAASTLTLSEGGSAYLTVSGPATTSSAATGSLQHVSFTQEVVGTRTATPSADVTVEVLLVGGGGGGASGGGGGGEVVRQIVPLSGGWTYSVGVGVGGSAGSGSGDGGPGTASTLTRDIDSVVLVSAAGGAGGTYAGVGGVSTFAGGLAGLSSAGGGGGGAGGPGSDAAGETGGAGGDGREVEDFISPSVFYGGGGGGGSYVGVGGVGGSGGGGAGGSYDIGSSNGVAGGAATGGGGGGSSPDGGSSGAGGTGLVVIRYYGAPPEVEIGFGGAA